MRRPLRYDNDPESPRPRASPFTRQEHPDMLNRWPIYDRVLANLVDGSALDGILIDRRGPLLVLADVTLYSASAEPTALDGEVYVERDRVLYLQTAPPKGG